jgi:mono/diheme cytochrome c family protein
MHSARALVHGLHPAEPRSWRSRTPNIGARGEIGCCRCGTSVAQRLQADEASHLFSFWFQEHPMNTRTRLISILMPALALAACGGGGGGDFVDYRIVGPDGNAPRATVGDALRLAVVGVRMDGTTASLPAGAGVDWSGPPRVEALPNGSDPMESILPQAGTEATGMWLENPEHFTAAELAGVLYVLDAGTTSTPTLTVKATLASGGANGNVSATIPISPFPAGSAVAGKAFYGDNCGNCHGADGEGGSAPGLDTEPGNVAGDPGWTPQMLGLTARSNVDNMGVSLDPSMPKWLTLPDKAGKLITTQEFSDVYAFLKTEPEASKAN